MARGRDEADRPASLGELELAHGLTEIRLRGGAVRVFSVVLPTSLVKQSFQFYRADSWSEMLKDLKKRRVTREW